MVSDPGTERHTGRLEAFSDAVLAIAITLPVAELHAPQAAPGQVLGALLDMWRDYLAYALSFVVIGVYWATSHFSGKLLEKTDHYYNLINLAFLAAVAMVPLPTRLMVEHADDDQVTAATVYTGWLFLCSALWTLRWVYSIRAQLHDPRLTPAYHRMIARELRLMLLGHALSVALVLVDYRVGLALAALVTLRFALAPDEPEYKPGEAPATEIEEADERPR